MGFCGDNCRDHHTACSYTAGKSLVAAACRTAFVFWNMVCQKMLKRKESGMRIYVMKMPRFISNLLCKFRNRK